MLDEAIQKYKSNPNEQSLTHVHLFSTLVATKAGLKGKDISKVMRDVEEAKKIHERLNSNQS